MEGMRDVLRATLGRSLRAMPPIDRLRAAWPVTCGVAMAQHGNLLSLVDEVLYVEVTDPAWMQQMTSMTGMLASDLKRVAGVKVSAIHFEFRQQPGSGGATGS